MKSFKEFLWGKEPITISDYKIQNKHLKFSFIILLFVLLLVFFGVNEISTTLESCVDDLNTQNILDNPVVLGNISYFNYTNNTEVEDEGVR